VEEGLEPVRRMARRSRRITDRTDKPDTVFFIPAMISEAGSSAGASTAGISHERMGSDDKESLTSMMSFSSVASREKKKRMTSTTTDVPDELVLEMRTISTADIGAELTRRTEEIVRVAITSSNLKCTYIKTLKEATRSGRWGLPAALELQECSWCGASISKSSRSPKGDRGENARLSALEKKIEELRPSIMRTVEDRLQGRRRSPKARPRKEPTAAALGSITQLSSLPREQEGCEWKVVELCTPIPSARWGGGARNCP
jgi:hypothetical protein